MGSGSEGGEGQVSGADKAAKNRNKNKNKLGMSPGRAKAQFGNIDKAGKPAGGGGGGLAKTTAKQEEFSSYSGQKYSGTTTAKPQFGPSPGDVNAIVGSTQSKDVKAGLSGVKGINKKNLGQLQQRAQVGQVPETFDVNVFGYDLEIPSPVGYGMNLMGKKMASTVMQKIGKGGNAVFSTSGEIVGVTDNSGIFGSEVYTGQVGYDPTGRKDVKRVGRGYMLGKAEGPQGDGGAVKSTSAKSTSPTSSVSVPSAQLSGAAKKSAIAARAAGAARRQFLA